MKILIVSQYFWPEQFRINDLALGLKEKGNDVVILTGIPNYPKGKFFEGYSFWKNNDEVWNDIPIYRSKLFSRGNGGFRLMINYASFVFFATIKGWYIKQKFDKILVFEPSPITVGIPAIFLSKKMKIPYYFWVQDLWPESLTAAGGINNKIVIRFFDWITKLIYKKAEKILVQSRGFESYIQKQGNFSNKIVYYPNSAEAFYKPLIPQEDYLSKLPKGFKLMFAGNIGEAQGITTLITAANIVKNKGYEINWIFLGDGRQKEQYLDEVKRQNLEDNVHFLGSFPAEAMPSFFACADAMLVSLKENKIFSLTIPAKIQSYLASGKPILASLDGEGARIINESQAGFTAPSENAVLFADQVITFYNLPISQKEKMTQNAISYFKNEFEREMLIDRLIAIMQ